MFLERVPRKVVPPVRVDLKGETGPTRDQARGPGWRRTSRGLYVPSGVDGSAAEQRIAEAAAVLPPGGAVTGWAALHWLGGRWFGGLEPDGRTPRPVVVASARHDSRPQAGIQICAERLDPRDVIVVDGIPVTTAVRSVCFEMRYARGARQAVVSLDMAAYDDLVSIVEVAVYAARHRGWTGIPRCRTSIPLANENSWSPTEVTMRLVWEFDAGRLRPLCNQPVFDSTGHHLGTPDLIDPVFGVVGEYDGALHLKASARSRDLTREEVFRSHDLEYVTMVADDQRDPRAFLVRLEAAYRRAERRLGAARPWTLERPGWWIDTCSVKARHALTPAQRDRVLRYRQS